MQPADKLVENDTIRTVRFRPLYVRHDVVRMCLVRGILPLRTRKFVAIICNTDNSRGIYQPIVDGMYVRQARVVKRSKEFEMELYSKCLCVFVLNILPSV